MTGVITDNLCSETQLPGHCGMGLPCRQRL